MTRREALAALIALPAAARVSVAALKPDDVIVIECAVVIDQEELSNIRNACEVAWPGRRVVVLERGLTLKIAGG